MAKSIRNYQRDHWYGNHITIRLERLKFKPQVFRWNDIKGLTQAIINARGEAGLSFETQATEKAHVDSMVEDLRSRCRHMAGDGNVDFFHAETFDFGKLIVRGDLM